MSKAPPFVPPSRQKGKQRKAATRKPFLESLPKSEQDRIILERLLAEKKMPGGVTYPVLGQRYGLAERTVRLWYVNHVPEARKQAVMADYLDKKAKDDAKKANAMGIVLGEDIEADFRWVLRELKRLLEEGKDDGDKILQLASLKETTRVLDKLANLLGLMTKRVDVTIDLNASPQWIEMRTVLMRVLRNHPDAFADFQRELAQMKGGPVIEHQT